eukprot:CAMPEP_0172940336 /NCGR_PEP_ID=MMETSP1075-20121228/223983_1 /TAXON_ID=2916 /ORGANISM="Ceratium fusus, Strain PA161109" /LENGTH=314 /DNA_ID=CAMNT_0013801731 /DNA_START=394 /DNA_END=1337 /DNA_ORIENTATION=-
MASARREGESVATWERWANAATWKRGGQHAASSLVVPAACLSACTCASTCSPSTSDGESIEWPPSPGDTPRLWKPPGRCSSPCKWTTDFNNIHNCDAYVEAHEFTDKRSSDRVIRIADRIAPPVISTPPMSMQSASAAWLPPAPPSSVPPKLLQTMLPFTQDDLEQARRAAVARARTHAKARAAQFKKEEDEEERAAPPQVTTIHRVATIARRHSTAVEATRSVQQSLQMDNDLSSVSNCDAYVDAHDCNGKRSSDCVIRIAGRIAPPVISTPPMSMQSASFAWLPPTPAPSEPPMLPQTMLPFTEDIFEQAHM